MHQQNKRGFTLIELMLAMTFLSVLLVAIAMLTIQISNTYTKGITLRQVNDAGLAVSNDFQRSIQASAPFSLPSGEGENTDTDSVITQETGGRLCLGGYSYAWNYGKFLAQTTIPLSNHFADGTPDQIHLVKIADAGKKMCQKVDDVYPIVPSGDKTTELLAAGDRDLALQQLSISGSQQTGLYAISLTIGTNTRDQLQDDNCKTPSEDNGTGAQNYCAVNKFDIVVRTGSKEGQQ